MNELMNACPIIRQKGGRLFTTSIDVAEKLGKQHKNVLQAIQASLPGRFHPQPMEATA